MFLQQASYTPSFGGLGLSTDGELLGPVAVIVTTATREYLNKYFEQPDVDPLHQRLHSVQERLLLVDYYREDWQVVE